MLSHNQLSSLVKLDHQCAPKIKGAMEFLHRTSESSLSCTPISKDYYSMKIKSTSLQHLDLTAKEDLTACQVKSTSQEILVKSNSDINLEHQWHTTITNNSNNSNDWSNHSCSKCADPLLAYKEFLANVVCSLKAGTDEINTTHEGNIKRRGAIWQEDPMESAGLQIVLTDYHSLKHMHMYGLL